MAWHVLHTILDQVRIHATFPGKLWIMLTFIFRILIVARIGDHVYHDEQEFFYCNTLTPGCQNVCFNQFSPISQLRYWSLMVMTVSFPTILFFLYSTHKIYHASAKFPLDEEESISSKYNNFLLTKSRNSLNSSSSSGKKQKNRKTQQPFFKTSPVHSIYSRQCQCNKKHSQLYKLYSFRDRKEMDYLKSHPEKLELQRNHCFSPNLMCETPESDLVRLRSRREDCLKTALSRILQRFPANHEDKYKDQNKINELIN